ELTLRRDGTLEVDLHANGPIPPDEVVGLSARRDREARYVVDHEDRGLLVEEIVHRREGPDPRVLPPREIVREADVRIVDALDVVVLVDQYVGAVVAADEPLLDGERQRPARVAQLEVA